MPIENALASIAVQDLKAAEKWYEKLIGRPADSQAMPELREWKFPRGGGLQVYHLPERAGASSCTLTATDFDAQILRLREMGVDATNQSSGPAARVVMITDPDGNHIAIVEA